MEAGGTVRQCVPQERTQQRGAGRQISSAWCLGEVEERNGIRFLFAMEILPGNPAFVKFEGHARPAGNVTAFVKASGDSLSCPLRHAKSVDPAGAGPEYVYFVKAYWPNDHPREEV